MLCFLQAMDKGGELYYGTGCLEGSEVCLLFFFPFLSPILTDEIIERMTWYWPYSAKTIDITLAMSFQHSTMRDTTIDAQNDHNQLREG